MFKKSIAVAVPTFAAAALVAAASLTGGAVQANSADKVHAPKVSNKAVVLTKCSAGTQKGAWDRGVSGFINANGGAGDTSVPGSTIAFKGPKKGKDVLSVNFSAGTYLTAGSGTIKVMLDGVPIRPSDNVDGSFVYGQASEYDNVSRNYCAKVSKGNHTLTVTYRNNAAAGNAFYLYDPMVHAELSD